ncbi:ABC-F family ATP-binding cassette domain-containing protein [Deinococcus radiophilus]|uniref:ABC-F family ATP-binding cassette domain-containing protein n=1 Tax=Deinococcus radiophilus TaxID=32062 RepID=A0A431W378_9DEIO|nr:ABC-F family ATP-binding cassette domain-containing protein [Deinococcus radiophilus]RTR29852.1 ABC-F family ATP-binding cassette domain-containing protein [Deinococcus radiophilus]UFA49796.1 ATP-binding cassette domain-containing protein [Deinococcus radiophilus]
MFPFAFCPPHPGPVTPPSSTLIYADSLRLGLGGGDLLAGVSLTLQAGERVALLGRNGAGKTTLLHLLAGRRAPDSGEVWWSAGLRLVLLDQHRDFGPNERVGELLDAAHPYRALEAQAAALVGQLGDPAALERWTALQARLELAQAAAWPARVGRMLAALGLRDLPDLRGREARSLSGGEQTRLALALTLAQEPDLLLLDEPTNHLDVRMREWLEHHLRSLRSGVLLTSHDRDFLDAVSGRSLWLAAGDLTEYPGGYSQARAQRELERRTRSRQVRQQQRESQRLEAAAGQLDRWGRRARPVRSRAGRVSVPGAPLPERQLRMRLLSGDARARLLAWGEHLNVTYGERRVLRDARFKLRQGDRVCVLGANGTGKTTLLRLLAGELRADPGIDAALRLAGGVTLAYLDQTWHGLTPGEGLYAQFERRFGDVAAALLGAAGFGAAHWPLTPEQLSGGERSRAGLALVSGLRSDLLLLDEPTNHLDIEALQALEGAVQAYGGALVIVTHDRRFAREVATRLWVIEGGELREVLGWGRSEYTDPARVLDGDPPPAPPPPSPPQQMFRLERRWLDLQTALDAPSRPSGREEARLRAEAAAVQLDLYAAYAEVYAAEVWDAEAPEPPLRVRGVRFETGGMFWAAGQPDCPHLAWDGHTLRPSDPLPAEYGAALLGGALRLLFERWNVGRVRLGAGGRWLTRREWFGQLGLVGGG